jgi:hypothetical protein
MSPTKRTSLDAVFGAREQREEPAPKNRGEKAGPETLIRALAAEPDPHEPAGGARRPNVKQHTAYLPIPVHEQLRRLAFEENRKMHDYLVEGLDRVFADRGLPAVKDLT